MIFPSVRMAEGFNCADKYLLLSTVQLSTR